MQNSRDGKILLLELAKLEHVIDIVEYNTSHAACHDDSIVILHNARALQGDGMARFESKTGQFSRGSFLPEMVLAHELFHAGQYLQATFFEPYCNLLCSWTGGPWKLPKRAFEVGAVKYTNQIRIDKDLGYVRTYLEGFGGTKVDSYDDAKNRQSRP